MNATLTNVSVLCTVSKRTFLQWLTMSADHPAITLVNFFLENYLLVVWFSTHRPHCVHAREASTNGGLRPYTNTAPKYGRFAHSHVETCPCTRAHRRTAASANVTTSFHTFTILVDKQLHVGQTGQRPGNDSKSMSLCQRKSQGDLQLKSVLTQ